MTALKFIPQKINPLSLCIILSFICFFSTTHASNDVIVKHTAALTDSVTLPNSPCSFSGNFIQTKTISGLDKKLESSGSFYYHCQAGVIWSTNSPINETLIFSRTGNNTQIKEQNISTLKGRQSKLLGRLLNSMMGGNQVEIEQQFSLSMLESKTNKFELLPKKKSLKRAIKQIQLMFNQTENNALESSLNQTSIQIRDRKDQLTHIESTQTNTFELTDADSDQLRHSHCVTSGLTSLACDQLYPQPE